MAFDLNEEISKLWNSLTLIEKKVVRNSKARKIVTPIGAIAYCFFSLLAMAD